MSEGDYRVRRVLKKPLIKIKPFKNPVNQKAIKKLKDHSLGELPKCPDYNKPAWREIQRITNFENNCATCLDLAAEYLKKWVSNTTTILLYESPLKGKSVIYGEIGRLPGKIVMGNTIVGKSGANTLKHHSVWGDDV